MQKTVGVIFSKDRAMQLDACLQSFSINCRDMQDIDLKVIWICSTPSNEKQYKELANTYPAIEFIRQLDFESQVLSTLAGYEYVLFLVDDCIFVREFSIRNIIESLKSNPNALGFSLRLGTNINYCYPLGCRQQLPDITTIQNDFLKYDWTTAQHDFAYPLEVSSSVFQVEDIIFALKNHFNNPNTLEMHLNNSKIIFNAHKKYLLCPKYSYGFCIPVNKVQETFNNRAGETYYYSPDKLGKMFMDGYRIDVEQYKGFIPNACHQEMELMFIKMHAASQILNIKQDGLKGKDDIPIVSVIMPVYNAEEYVGLAIESILNQDFRKFEFIIIDDGSTDNSLNIIKTYIDPRIVLVRNETNLKLVASLNKGLHIARGKYIARMDADDISLPARLGKQVEFMEEHPEVGVCGTWVELFGGGEGRGCYSNDPGIAKGTLLFGCSVAHPSVMMSREILESGLSYSPSYPHAEDYALWVQIAKTHQISNLAEVLLKYRISSNQVSAKFAKEQIETTIKIQMEQLYALGIKPTGQELSLHWIISKKQFVPAQFVQAAFEWLTKIKEANLKIHYYPEAAFAEVLSIYWRSVCQNLLTAF